MTERGKEGRTHVNGVASAACRRLIVGPLPTFLDLAGEQASATERARGNEAADLFFPRSSESVSEGASRKDGVLARDL